MNTKKPLLFIALFLWSMGIFAQQGGMWIPSLLEGMNEKEMQSLGMQLTAKDIYNVNQSSLKDAIVHFGGGCTSEIISPKGLLLTNHHCGYGQIQSHSTVQNDYLQDGFWAMKMTDELPNPGLTATLIVKIEDVTKQILEGTQNLTSEKEKQSLIEKNIQSLVTSFPKESWQENRIRSFYEGNQYLLFVVETFKDVRLVGAPPSSIGKFGSDTDNWVWPRHTGDFALFRIYANTNNQPADYSPNNVPYQPKHFLPVATYGVEEDDFTMVFGFPGRTQEYLPAVAVKQIVEDLNPAKIEIRDIALKVQDGFMRKDQAIKIKYASKYASIANAWKKWIGENQGLKKSNAIAIKQKQEKEFLARVQKSGKTSEYGNLLNEFEDKYQAIAPYALARDYFMEVVMRNSEFMSFGYRIHQLEQVLQNRGEQAFNDRKTNLLKTFESLFKDYDKKVDEKVFEQLLPLYLQKTPKQFLPNNLMVDLNSNLVKTYFEPSLLHDLYQLQSLLKSDANEFKSKLQKDTGYQLIKQITDAYLNNVVPTYEVLNTEIAALQRTYMKGILEFSKPEDRIFPDANSTLRITYGKVKGYQPQDAVTYHPITYLDGVIEKYVPGDYEFDLPAKLIDLYEKKDYGTYADKNGKLPVCFIATNHTTGGNSGSPAIDANGNLIGLNFDRVWEGTMSDIYYDPNICRNIMVDARYILFVVDKFAGAKHLVEEMKLVYKKPKAKKKSKSNKKAKTL